MDTLGTLGTLAGALVHTLDEGTLAKLTRLVAALERIAEQLETPRAAANLLPEEPTAGVRAIVAAARLLNRLHGLADQPYFYFEHLGNQDDFDRLVEELKVEAQDIRHGDIISFNVERLGLRLHAQATARRAAAHEAPSVAPSSSDDDVAF